VKILIVTRYKASLAQSLPFVGFCHRLKYLHNLQSHSVI
jgi:hypothetical protein